MGKSKGRVGSSKGEVGNYKAYLDKLQVTVKRIDDLMVKIGRTNCMGKPISPTFFDKLNLCLPQS